MTAVTERYGMSSRAFMVVPIVGAFLVDIIYQPQTIAFIKFLSPPPLIWWADPFKRYISKHF